MRGNEIVFTAGGVQYRGTVNGTKMEGSSRAGAWSASRG
jgi:hypothetical protein